MSAAATGKADRWFGLFWIALGGAIAIESWRMDRLEQQHINPMTVPGLVPGLLGLLLVVFGLALALRRHAVSVVGEAPEEEDRSAEPWRMALAVALTLGFGFGLIGTGLPFWLVCFLFVFLAIILFEWRERKQRGTLARGLVVAALVAAGSAAAITFIFRDVFLVRMP